MTPPATSTTTKPKRRATRRGADATKPIDLTRLRAVGFSQRPQRVRRNLLVCAQYVRQTSAGLSEAETQLEARALYDELERSHPHALKQFELTAPTCRAVDRRGKMSNVEIAAMRSLDQVRTLEAELERYHGGPRIRRNPALARAILECHAWRKGIPEVRTWHEELAVNRNLTLDWSLGHPVGRNGEAVRGESATYELLGSILERTDPTLAIALNVAAIRQLADTHADIGRYCAVDGTSFEAPGLQRLGLCDAEELDIRAGMEARLLSHGDDKTWRGWVLLQINCIKSTLPLVWGILPLEEGREFMGVPLLLDLLFELWPNCPIEYLVGDKEFAVADLHRELEFRYHVHPVVPHKGRDGAGQAWFANRGAPVCSKHGQMKLEFADGFPKTADRIARVAGGEPVLEGDLDQRAMAKARNRWVCADPGCRVRETTYFDTYPTLYPFLPHRSSNKKTGLRVALQKRRNSAESVIRGVELMNVTLPGQAKASWLSTRRRAEWLAGLTLGGQTWRRLAHEGGAYERAEREARAAGVVK